MSHNVVVVWPSLCQGMRTSSFCNAQHDTTRRNRVHVVKRAQRFAPTFVTICCVKLLRSFGRDLAHMVKLGAKEPGAIPKKT